MGKLYYISPIDYGPGNNDKYPRWAVWLYRDSGWPFNIRTRPKKVAGPFWTEEEAQTAFQELSD